MLYDKILSNVLTCSYSQGPPGGYSSTLSTPTSRVPEHSQRWHSFTATVGDTDRNSNVQSVEHATSAAAASWEVALGEDLWEDVNDIGLCY